MFCDPLAQWFVAKHQVHQQAWRAFPRHGDSNLFCAEFERCPPNPPPAVLGEFNQDGFLITPNYSHDLLSPQEFPGERRRWRRLELISRNDALCVRKTFPHSMENSALSKFVCALDYWTEAAALIRLQGLPFVPVLLEVNSAELSVTMEYLAGDNLRNLLGQKHARQRYDTLDHTFEESVTEAGPATGRQVAAMLEALLSRGVAPRDLHPANFVRRTRSGQLCVVDFHLSWLRPVPAFWKKAGELRQLIERLQTQGE